MGEKKFSSGNILSRNIFSDSFDSLTNISPRNIYHSPSTRRSLHSCWTRAEFHVGSGKFPRRRRMRCRDRPPAILIKHERRPVPSEPGKRVRVWSTREITWNVPSTLAKVFQDDCAWNCRTSLEKREFDCSWPRISGNFTYAFHGKLYF